MVLATSDFLLLFLSVCLMVLLVFLFFFFSSRRRHTRCLSDWSSDVCSSDLIHPRARILEFFAQDDFKVTPRLTVNAGLRSTLNFPSTETDNQGAIFNLQTDRKSVV